MKKKNSVVLEEKKVREEMVEARVEAECQVEESELEVLNESGVDRSDLISQKENELFLAKQEVDRLKQQLNQLTED